MNKTRVAGHTVYWRCNTQVSELLGWHIRDIAEWIDCDKTSGTLDINTEGDIIEWYIVDYQALCKELYETSVEVYNAVVDEYGRDERMQILKNTMLKYAKLNQETDGNK